MATRTTSTSKVRDVVALSKALANAQRATEVFRTELGKRRAIVRSDERNRQLMDDVFEHLGIIEFERREDGSIIKRTYVNNAKLRLNGESCRVMWSNTRKAILEGSAAKDTPTVRVPGTVTRLAKGFVTAAEKATGLEGAALRRVLLAAINRQF